MVYGSVHLTAWNFDFPSRAEQIIKRAACIIIAGGILGSCMAVGIIVAFGAVGDRIFGKGWIKEMDDKVEDWLAIPLSILGVIVVELLSWGLAALYFGARLFVIVESFISIRRLPLGVFVTAHWANYIPHL